GLDWQAEDANDPRKASASSSRKSNRTGYWTVIVGQRVLRNESRRSSANRLDKAATCKTHAQQSGRRIDTFAFLAENGYKETDLGERRREDWHVRLRFS